MTSQILSTDKSRIKLNSLPLLGQHLAAMLLGVAILFIVGFMPLNEMHNAAHDTRHALAFPCH